MLLPMYMRLLFEIVYIAVNMDRTYAPTNDTGVLGFVFLLGYGWDSGHQKRGNRNGMNGAGVKCRIT